LSSESKLNITVVVEQRVQVSARRLRVPDICVVLGKTKEQIFRTRPFLCVEILSPEDRMSRVEERVADYLSMGVRYVWILNPATKHVYVATAAEGICEFKGAVLRTEDPVLEMPLAEVFE
jgi:Uma2 family endonuclease